MNVIVLHDMRNGIARDGKQMIHIPKDLARFRRLTIGKTVVMGRKTAEIIGKPLDGRTNLVMTNNLSIELPNGFIKDTYDAEWPDDTFTIGGEQVYRYALQLPRVNRIYGTIVVHDFGCDKFFPMCHGPGWVTTWHSDMMVYVDDSGMEYHYCWYTQERTAT